MPKTYSKKFFVKKGKSLSTVELESLQLTQFPREAISSLATAAPSKKELIIGKFMDLKSSTRDILSRDFIKAYSGLIGSSAITALFLLTFVFHVPLFKSSYTSPNKYSLFSSMPLMLNNQDQAFNFRDSRAVRIDSTFEFFSCPLEGYGSKFVEEADRNEIPYWLVAAIAFQESSCGKNTPYLDGVKTKNAWGWATYGDQVYEFDSWDQGIEVVSRYMSKKFYSRGVTDLCEIMKTYTPPSNGSWCNGVRYFGDFIQNYKTPQES